MFFYSVKDRFATGKEEYDNLGDCIITLLKVQEEAHQQRNQETGIR
jgi:ssRNA-specific RNase YbeY (16S rRNA maturation enzyme)